MTRDQEIKTALDRLVEIYKRRPEAAVETAVNEGILEGGTKCVVEQGEYSAVMDLPETMGGSDQGPTPGFYARAGILGCVCIGIKVQAARAGIQIHALKARIECDFDDKACYELCEKTAAPLETRLEITVASDRAENEITAFIENVLEHDPWFLALRDAQSVRSSVKAAVDA